LKRFLSFLINNNRRILIPCALLTLLPAAAPMAESALFPVPDVIKHNTAFWVRIYTEISLKEGLLHDNEHPQITYERVSSGELTGKKLSEHIDTRRKVYVDAIIAVRDSAPAKWGAAEKRVAELFRDAPAGAIDSAEHRIRHQRGQRERFRAGLERSAMYLDTISAILREHGVPDELKYLPHVESSFDAEAYSHVGAAGLWQFMRATGRGYMKIDYMFDERRDPIISSVAAAKFLRANYDMLQEWPLAITAYNHGPNGIRRAVESLGTRDIAVILKKHESASFRFASKNFYSCFVAVLQIMEKPDKYFKGLKYKPKFSATAISLPFAVRPDALCKSLNITESQFKALNPSLRPVVFTQKKALPAGYRVNLPDTIKADAAIAALNSTPATQRVVVAAASQKGAGTAGEPDGDGYYTVARGDNLQGIAQRSGVSMRELAEANNITNSSRIYVGQVLTIPGSGSSGTPKVAAAPTKVVKPVPLPDTVKTVATKPPKDTVKTVAAAKPSSTSSKPSPDTVRIDTAKTVAITATPSKPLPDTARIDTVKTVAAAATPSSKPLPDTVRIDTAKTVAATATPSSTPSTDLKIDTALTVRPEPRMLTGIRVTVTPPSILPAPVKPKPADTAKVVSLPIKDTVKTDTQTSTPTSTATAATTTLTDTLSAAALLPAEPPPEISVSDPSGKPSTDPRFDAGVYDLAVRVAADGQSARVRVLVDETVGHFSEWMRVSADEIRRRNDMSPGAALKMGDRVHIPIKSTTNVKRFETSRLQYHMAIEEDFFAQYSVVDFERRKIRPGDNVWRICADAKIPMWLLNKYNSKTFYSLIPGNSLWIPRISPKEGAHEAANEFDPAVSESEITE